MPVGVPYVEYQLPGNPEPEYINMYNALYRERMLFLCQEIEDTISNELIGLMLYLNAEDPSRALFLYINSPGGSVTCGIGIYDIMRYLNSGITTICMGTAASMASFILAGGTYGRRIALPNSRIMIHQPEGGSDGQATEILSESSEVARIRRQVGLIYANRTQQSIEKIAQDLDRDQFMSAQEAREYGLIDYVARLQKEEYEPGYDLLGLKSDSFQIPDFLKKLAIGPVDSGLGPDDSAFSDPPLSASLPGIFPVIAENKVSTAQISKGQKKNRPLPLLRVLDEEPSATAGSLLEYATGTGKLSLDKKRPPIEFSAIDFSDAASFLDSTSEAENPSDFTGDSIPTKDLLSDSEVVGKRRLPKPKWLMPESIEGRPVPIPAAELASKIANALNSKGQKSQ
jgi:ATP-dependent Clp protease, protease subunit